jgi:predicted nuclease of predicted toxin-antitoxin system
LKILLDENLDWRLERYLPGHLVESVQFNGWAGLKNGDLLSKAQEQFDVFITLDRSIEYQQTIRNYGIIVIALRARSNRLQDTWPLMTQVLKMLPVLRAGTITHVG